MGRARKQASLLAPTRGRKATGRQSYARKLRINLASRREKELFKWFLACLLFGKPIQTEIAEQAYRELIDAGLDSPDAITRAGWDKLVLLLDRAHYVRYDFSTATKLLEVCQELTRRYGTITSLLASAHTASELSRKLQEFKYIGPVTARIFLREIRPLWYRKLGRPKAKSSAKRESFRPLSASKDMRLSSRRALDSDALSPFPSDG